MTTIKSYFNQSKSFSIYKATLKSLIPVMTVLCIILFTIISLPFIYGWINGEIYYNYNYIYNFNELTRFRYNDAGIFFDEAQSTIAIIVCGVVALMLAMLVNSYMHSKKNVDLYHSIPVTRSGLLTANALASMTAIALPLLFNYLLTMFLQLIAYSGRFFIMFHYHWFNFHSFACTILYALVIYFFVTLVSVNVGTVFDTFSISTALGCSVLLVYLVSGSVWSDLSYGAYFQPDIKVTLLSPFSFIFYKYEFQYMDHGNEILDMMLFMLGSLIAAAVFYFLAIFRYKKRGSELAEQTQTSGVFQTAVKMVACFGGTALFYLIFNGNALPGQIIAGFIGAILAGVIAELIFSRGFKSMLKNAKWIAGTGAFCCLLIVVVSLDLTGYVRRVPSPESVKTAGITYQGRFRDLVNNPWSYSDDTSSAKLELPESIATVTSAHQIAVDQRPDVSNGVYNRYYDTVYANIELDYKLKSGFDLKRHYYAISKNAASELVSLEDNDDFIRQRSPLFLLDENREGKASLLRSVTVYDSFRISGTTLRVSASDTDMLLDALREDMLNESYDEILYPSAPALGFVKLDFWPNEEYRAYHESDSYDNYNFISQYVVVTQEYTKTIALLKAFGVYEAMDAQFQPDSVYVLWDSPTNGYNEVVTSTNQEYHRSRVYDYWSASEASNDSDRYWYNELVASSSSPFDVAAVYAAASNQMLSEPRISEYDYDTGIETHINSDYSTYYVVFAKGGQVYGSKLVHYRNLPQSIREAIDEYSENYRYNGQYARHFNAIVPEEVTIVQALEK